MKASFLNIRDTRPEDHPRDPGPMDRGKAHGAWFGGGIDHAIRKIETFEFSGRETDGIHLRVAGSIVILKNGVMRNRDPLTSAHDRRSEGASLRSFDPRLSGSYRKLHPLFPRQRDHARVACRRAPRTASCKKPFVATSPGFLASVSPAPKSSSRPSRSVTRPPASSIAKAPAATSHILSR